MPDCFQHSSFFHMIPRFHHQYVSKRELTSTALLGCVLCAHVVHTVLSVACNLAELIQIPCRYNWSNVSFSRYRGKIHPIFSWFFSGCCKRAQVVLEFASQIHQLKPLFRTLLLYRKSFKSFNKYARNQFPPSTLLID